MKPLVFCDKCFVHLPMRVKSQENAKCSDCKRKRKRKYYEKRRGEKIKES